MTGMLFEDLLYLVLIFKKYKIKQINGDFDEAEVMHLPKFDS